MSRAPAAALLAIVVVAAALRFTGLGLPGLSSDEAFSWRLVGYALPETLRRAALDVHPPLYYVVLHPWAALVGASPRALRALSAVLGVLSVLAVALVVREAARPAIGPRVWLSAALGAALVALSPAQVAQGRNARMYALGIFLALASALLLLRALREGGRSWAAWGATSGLLVATHYYGLLSVVAQGLAALVGRRWRGVLAGAAAAVLVFAAWIPFALDQARRVGAGYWIQRPAGAQAIVDFAASLTGLDLPVGLAAAIALAGMAVLLDAARRCGVAGLALLAQALAPWVLALAWSALGPRPIYLERYMVFAQVAAFALVGLGAASSRVGTAAAVALVVSNAAGAALLVRDLPRSPSAMAQAARFLKRQAGPDALVLADSPRALNRLRAHAGEIDAQLVTRVATDAEPPLPPHYSHAVSLVPGDEVTLAGAFAGEAPVWRVRDGAGPAPPAPPGHAITFVRALEGGDGSRVHVTRYERRP